MPSLLVASEPSICWLDGQSASLDAVGGKGASLSRLRAFGAPVPLAAAISTQVYREIAASLDVPAGLAGVAQTDLAVIRERIMAAALPESFVESLDCIVEEFREKTGSVSPTLAVRSSAPAEDSEKHAFAGLHDTILDVRPGAELEQAIRQCWASLWSDRAVAYRHEHNLQHLPMDIAVVIQDLVRCDVSFVAFALDPVTGSDECVVINSTWGLGEAVVAGLVVPDQIRVDRCGGVRDFLIGSKSVMVIPGSHGVRVVPVPRVLQQQPSMSAELAAHLADIVRSLSIGLGFPADVEGGLVGDKLYLFQARPITRTSLMSLRSSRPSSLQETHVHEA